MYREDKATQMAAKFIVLAGGRINYLLLIKMMYVADKTMLLKRAIPITFDSWVLMPLGPVLSKTCNRIRIPAQRADTYWGDHIETVGFDVVLTQDPGDDDLSRNEDRVIEDVYAEWGSLNQFHAADLTHEFPEWEDPQGSSNPISYEKVMLKNGSSYESVQAMLENVEIQQMMRELAQAH